uniref:Uncharacterized protein n=1 Tax=Anopheles maculatus TaxID=74869 RepID=A0A182SEU8_9DIPT
MNESNRRTAVPVVGVDSRGHTGATLASSVASSSAASINHGTDAMLIQGDKSAPGGGGTGGTAFGPTGGGVAGSIATGYDSDGEDPSTGCTSDDTRKDTGTNLKDLHDNSSSR